MNGVFLGLPVNIWTILAAAIVTYGTRIGGHLLLSRFKRIPPRIDAALNAVPAAVLTTLVAPAVITGSAEALTLAVCLLIGLRAPVMAMLGIGWAMIVALRAAGL
ncbi:AzlD domain-containing protein [Hoeflea sp. YIM 152468]|uniref:AzlD family protein n=1 Tax=Hoeflea sp. YIM 152468 TaxID=3031759 RepID=UPI0023DB6C18|nr:AzlD domain-containing protein [Hoeflea sp. YIM 152468]MDF1609551.1 AzlD domain-containing protein [Hoeflea sp. YIM 152468]